jgi:hypothetical protein
MNGARGETEVVIGGTKYRLVPSFEAFAEMETLSGDGVTKLYQRATDIVQDQFGGLGLKQTAAILFACMKEGMNPNLPTFRKLGETLMREGYRQHALLCFEILQVAFPPSDRVPDGAEKKTQEKTTATDGE